MRSIFFLLCLFLYVAGASSQAFSEKEKQQILDKHNALRRREAYEKGAIGMAETTWSAKLAQKAQKEAEKCEYKEQTGPSYAKSHGFLKAAGNFGLTQAFWYSQKRHFDYDTSSCTAHPVACSTYLNIVQAKGASMGCGRHKCNVVKGYSLPGEVYFFVCHFKGSATSVKKGSKKFKEPYQKRAAGGCMKCPSASKYNFLTGLCA